MLAIGAGRKPTLVVLGRCWPERLLYLPAVLHQLALEDGEVLGRGWSRAAHMFVILWLTWRLADEQRWKSCVTFPALTEQRRNTGPFGRSGSVLRSGLPPVLRSPR